MRTPAHASDSLALIDTASAALSESLDDVSRQGAQALVRVLTIDQLAQPHLHRIVSELTGAHRPDVERARALWSAGERFWLELSAFYSACRSRLAGGPLPRNVVTEILAQRIRAGAHLLKWKAFAYFAPAPELWLEIGDAYREARDEGLALRTVSLKLGRNVQTSVEREYLRAIALGCASLDQLTPDSIDIADRLIRYLAPTLRLAEARGEGAAFSVTPGLASGPRRVLSGSESVSPVYFMPSGALASLDELAGVIAKGLVPTALATGSRARERVLDVAFHLRRLWASAPPLRRHRRHRMVGRLQVAMGFQRLRIELAATAGVVAERSGWELINVSRNGIGLVVPHDECDRLSVGDLLGVKSEDGAGWHIGVIRRIVRGGDGAAIIGMASIARSATSARIDDGKVPSEVLVFDPIRKGGAVRLAHALSAVPYNKAVYLNQDGHICKLRPLSTVLRGSEFEVLNYHVL